MIDDYDFSMSKLMNNKEESQALEIEHSLSCKVERIDQSSPELWPEQIPGVTSFSAILKASQNKAPILVSMSVLLQKINVYLFRIMLFMVNL